MGLRALSHLAEATGGRLWPAGSSAQLERTFLRILTEMRSRYLLSYDPMGGARGLASPAGESEEPSRHRAQPQRLFRGPPGGVLG